MRLRHRLIPYLYTAAWVNYQEGILPIRPMYHCHPNTNHAYQCPNEYTFGSELIAIPYTTPRDEDTRMSRQVVWLPEGDWFDFFTGDFYSGGGWYAIYGGLDRIPVFARAGGIIPLTPDGGGSGIEVPDTIDINIFPGADHTYQLYEDDGETQAYRNGEYAITTLKITQNEKHLQFHIQPVEGAVDLLPSNRKFNLVFHALQQPGSVTVKIDSQEWHPEWQYNPVSHQLKIPGINLPENTDLAVDITGTQDLVYRDNQLKEKIHRLLKDFKMNTFIKQSILDRLDEIIKNPFELKNYADSMAESQILALIETWLGIQNHRISDDPVEAFQRIIDLIYKLQ